jgi:hypothetical protein
MTGLPVLFAAAALLAALLASVAVWAPRRLPVKLGTLAAATLFLPLGWAAMADLLSRPKPVALEWWLKRAADATVLGSVIEEERRVYLWLQLDGSDQPRAYALPWDRRMAEQLQEAQREAAERQTAVRMRLPFEPSLDDREPKFYALPQPALPPKEPPPAPARVYNRPDADA